MSQDPSLVPTEPELTDAVDLLVVKGCIITVDPDRRMIEDGAVAVAAGRIVAVGATDEITARYPHASTIIDARGGVVTPGFVEGHVHLSQHLGRTSIPDTWQESREHEQWLPYWLNMTPQDAETSATLAAMEMVRNGTTCFSDMSGRFLGENQAAATERIGLRGMISETVWDIPPHASVGTGNTDECLASIERLLETFPKSERLSWAGVGLAGMGSASDALLIGARALAREHGVTFYLHQSFADADTRAYAEHAGGKTAVEHLGDQGLLGPDVHLVHLIKNSVREVEILAETGTSVVHCPAASLRWGLGVSRTGLIPEALDAGVNVALGSDSGNYSDFLDVGRQMYLATTIHREARGVVPSVTAEQALEMATINGARAVGRADEIGSIEVGKLADLVIHSSRRPEWHPRYEPVRSLVYGAQSTGVETVIIDGKVVLRDGVFVTIDEEAELAQIDRAAADLTRRMNFSAPGQWPLERSLPTVS
ncbi:MAG: amidohydrolase family protein [Actinomycetota bacterium]|nr:amidohydrolase family protein [Actinomycetota bacterium]